MGLYKERKLLVRNVTAPTVQNDVTVFNWTGTDTTLTPTRVDTATAGTTTGNITFSATDATAAANIQTAIRALGGIYADATCVAGSTADNMVITVYGGYDITWAKTGGVGTITESGAAGADTATPGSVTYVGYIPIGRFGIVKRLRLQGFNDNSLDMTIRDLGGGTGYRTVYTKTAIDTSTASADTPYDKMLTADGVAGEDGAAAASVNGGLFEGPLRVSAVTSAPVAARNLTPEVIVFVKMGRSSGLKKRSTGAFTGTTAEVSLGADIACVKRIYLKASADTTVAPSITDKYSKPFYVKTSSDYTTAVDAVLSMEGIDQADNAVADLLDVVVKSPATVTLTGLGSGTFTVDFYVET